MFWALAVVLLQSPAIPQALTTPSGRTLAAITTAQPSTRPVFETVSAAIPEPSWNKPVLPAHFEPGLPAAGGEAGDADSGPFAPGTSSSSMPLATPEPAARPLPFFGAERKATPKAWYALSAAGHGAATFDAWTTRRVITSGRGQELNPLLRPFANSSALYGAIQVGPSLLDYLGRRMMRSEKTWVRRMWWLPQVVGTASSLLSGGHNLALARHKM